MGLDERAGGEELGRVGGGEYIIRIYHMKNIYFKNSSGEWGLLLGRFKKISYTESRDLFQEQGRGVGRIH